MNRRLTDAQIRITCRALLAKDPSLTGRRLRRELKNRYDAVGKTHLVFDIWRDEKARALEAHAHAKLPTEVAELQRRLAIAESSAAENLKRAELAELREQAHQDHWALEVDRLRQEIAAIRGPSRPFPV